MARTFSGGRCAPAWHQGELPDARPGLVSFWGMTGCDIMAEAAAGHDRATRAARPSGRAVGRIRLEEEAGPFSLARGVADRRRPAVPSLQAPLRRRCSGVRA